MHDVMLLKMLDGLDNLAKCFGGVLLRVLLNLGHHVEQLSSTDHLHDKVEVGTVLEGLQQLHHISVLHAAHDAHFVAEHRQVLVVVEGLLVNELGRVLALAEAKKKS